MVRITINKAAIDKLTDYAVTAMKRAGDAADAAKEGFKRTGDAADAIGSAAAKWRTVAAEVKPRRRGTSAWAASAWADFLGRFTGR